MTDQEFKKQLSDSANKLRGAMSSAEYMFPVLGLLHLNYVSDIFDSQKAAIDHHIAEATSPMYMPEDARTDDRVTAARPEIAAPTQVRDLLLPRLISGRLRVEDAEATMEAA